MSSRLTESFMRLSEEYRRVAEQLEKDLFLNRIFKIANWQTRIYLTMFFDRREWTVMELSRYLNVDHPVVTKSLKNLLKRGYVKRISRKKWVVT